MEETKLIFKRASSDTVDKRVLLNALQESKSQLTIFSLENLEGEIMLDMMPCLTNLFSQIYADNQRINRVEQSVQLLENLKIAVSLIDIIDDLLIFISTNKDIANLKQLRSMVLEIPKCIYLTYKHCKESQKKYQNLMNDCKEILFLYKKNQECHLKFLNLMVVLDVATDEGNCKQILIEVIESVSQITEILLGLNIKALTDSWKSFCTLIEKYQDILAAEKFYCVKEIELLELQIRNFMDIALESNDEKQIFQYSKLSGFLLKVALKIITIFWEHLHLEAIYNLVCSVMNYSPEFLQKKFSADVNVSIQTCLLDVITSFVDDNFLNEDALEQVLTHMYTSKNTNKGCFELSIRILEFTCRQPPDSVDCNAFNAIVNTIFNNISMLLPEPADALKIPKTIIMKLADRIYQSIEVHNSLYEQDFEFLLFSNIVGNNIGCHIMSSTVWIQIIKQTAPHSKRQLISQLIEIINDARIELSFTSSKVILLKSFMQKLFSSLDDNERNYFLNLYPPSENMQLWKIIGFNFDCSNNSIMSLLDSISTNIKDMKKQLSSAEDVIRSVEAMKILAEAPDSAADINGSLTNNVQTMWDIDFEVVPCDNLFCHYLISCFFEITIKLMTHFTNDQIYQILKRMKMLCTTNYIKIRLCVVLIKILTRKNEHSLEQNRLNFVISDIFELLLKEKDDTLQELTLKTLQQFARNNQLIIVNNVSRMLPDMNLELYIRNNTDIVDSNNLIRVPDLKSMEHKCIVAKKTLVSGGNSFEWKHKNISRENSCDSINGEGAVSTKTTEGRSESPKFFSKPSLGLKRNTSFHNGQEQCKRVKLNENSEENDTINEVLQRIKSEIKCLNKVLNKEKPTAKNAQDIKLLACQLQNILEI